MQDELDRLVAEFRAAGLAHQDMLANIKTLWQNTLPRREGTWENFCVICLGKSQSRIDRIINGKTGHEASNVNKGAPRAPSLQSDEKEEDGIWIGWSKHPEVNRWITDFLGFSKTKRKEASKFLAKVENDLC